MSAKEQRVRVLLRTPICFNGGLAFSPGDEPEMDVADARRMYARALCERPQLREKDGELFDKLVASMTDQERAKLARFEHSSLSMIPDSALERLGLNRDGTIKGRAPGELVDREKIREVEMGNVLKRI